MTFGFVEVQCEGVVYSGDLDVLKGVHLEEVEREIQGYLFNLLDDGDVFEERVVDVPAFLGFGLELVQHALTQNRLSHGASDRAYF